MPTHRNLSVRVWVSAVMAGLLLLRVCAVHAREGPAAGEAVTFFPSTAVLLNGEEWSLAIQGRVFSPAESSTVRRKLVDILARRLGADPQDKLYRERAGYFVSDSSRNTRVSIQIGDRTIALASSNAAGYFTSDIRLSNSELVQLRKGEVIPFESVPTPVNPRRFTGVVRLVPETGVTVITDVDDTIKYTNVRDSKEKEANTFLRPFAPVPGMPERYRAWQKALGERIHFHVVSGGPWQFNQPLRRFFEQAGFPPFTWDMRSIDIGGNLLVDLREANSSPQAIYAFKVDKIRAFMNRFPKRSVVLVGDSGEQDPEVYATILSEFPRRVDAVFIHDVTGEERAAERYMSLFPGSALNALRVFRHPRELPPLSARPVGGPVR